jgi:uncharacterized protein YfaA (DUF2138 family)
MSITIGIDNGLSGGLVALGPMGGVIGSLVMPTKTVRLSGYNQKKQERKENRIDGKAAAVWINEVTKLKPCIVAIEECPEHADRASTMRSMAMSYGTLIGAIEAKCPHARLVFVRSGRSMDSWQRAMLGQVKDTKKAAQELAKSIWPNESWIVGKKRTPDSGLIDAALIAEHVRAKQ